MKSIKAKITKLSLKPGETILVRIKGKISDEQKDRLAEELKAGMPGLTSALIIPDDIPLIRQQMTPTRFASRQRWLWKEKAEKDFK